MLSNRARKHDPTRHSERLGVELINLEIRIWEVQMGLARRRQ
jgi:hypothetical protein